MAIPATARCSNGQPPGLPGCWRSGPMRDAAVRPWRLLRWALGDPPSGSRSPLQSPLALRFPLRSLSPPLAGSLRASLASKAVRSVDRFRGCAARQRRWGPCRWRELASCCAVQLCHTCSLRQPCGSSAALRRGEAPLGAAPGRPWLSRFAPCARTTRPDATPSSTNPTWLRSARVTQQDITSGQTLRTVQPQIGRSS